MNVDGMVTGIILVKHLSTKVKNPNHHYENKHNAINIRIAIKQGLKKVTLLPFLVAASMAMGNFDSKFAQ